MELYPRQTRNGYRLGNIVQIGIGEYPNPVRKLMGSAIPEQELHNLVDLGRGYEPARLLDTDKAEGIGP